MLPTQPLLQCGIEQSPDCRPLTLIQRADVDGIDGIDGITDSKD